MTTVILAANRNESSDERSQMRSKYGARHWKDDHAGASRRERQEDGRVLGREFTGRPEIEVVALVESVVTVGVWEIVSVMI